MTASDPAVRWHLLPELTAVLLNGNGSLQLDNWLRDGKAAIIKDAAHRTIYHVSIPVAKANGSSEIIDFYLKQYRAVGSRNRLREILRATKAKSEYDKASELSARGILAPRALGWGILGHSFAPNASFLLTETVTNTEHLTQVLDGLSPLRRQQLAKALGEYVAKLHAAGVTHRDLHPGNLLVRWSPNELPVFFLIDLHEVRLGRSLSWRRRRENLCIFNRYFILRASRADRLRFWRAYQKATGRAIPDRPDTTPTALEIATAKSNYQLWNARLKKYTQASRLVDIVEAPSFRGIVTRGLDPTFVTTFSARPDDWFIRPSTDFIKKGGRSTVVRIPQGVLKRFNYRSRFETIKDLFRTPPPARSWYFGHAFLDAGLPTPRPLLSGFSEDEWPFAWFLLTEELHGVVDLRQFVERAAALPPSQRRDVLRDRIHVIARTIRQMHDRHFGHRDLKAGNLLTPVEPADQRVWFIDLVGVSRRRRVSRKARIADLSRLLASFLKHPGLTHSDRLRFLFAYYGAANHSKAGWKRWWSELAEAAQAKVAKTASRGRPLG